MITIAGAGVAGLASAYELAKRGAEVTIYEAGSSPADNPSSWFAGGMLAPWCEGEVADPQVVRLGAGAINWWAQFTPVTRNGTLVLTPPRDRAELDRFARRTEHHRWVDAGEIATLEPALEGRFQRGLLFEDEAHLDPRRALMDLTRTVQGLGVEIRYATPAPDQVDVDCRGMASDLPGLRSIRGEMAVIEAPDVQISRTLRLLHPRIPLYLVPRGDDIYMIGATMVESASWKPVTVRSLLELLGAAFTLHPALGEASVIETGAGLRPAFIDNIPRLKQRGETTHVNGLYRHGYLLAPALAGQLARQFFQESQDETACERRTA
ncbi:FAD-dependent oxidoreductase [Aliiroseovarius sp. KMU-50]|uniref:FAD-dependent oxidoreductase n=1 Tax=Aliiroseovarius salicola TaxID=3009082 RepID=A0ABT4VZT3_9RHOB|nr:FAD-dependent oxidoreductase [Aliiroseovarius sp. KMU-50]MDA5093679.1 FAD-dependent oxidoreductase [Aliiroseovarius sp. KMU-50]